MRRKAEQPGGQLARSKTTTERHPRSFLESLVGDVGLYALQAAIVFLAAFVGAAMFQRVLVGNFKFKIGALDFTEAATLDAGVHSAKFDKELAESLEQTQDRMTEIEEALKRAAPTADLPENLGKFDIKVPDASQLIDRLSENFAMINAQGGSPFQGADYFKARISEPDEGIVKENNTDDMPTERGQAD